MVYEAFAFVQTLWFNFLSLSANSKVNQLLPSTINIPWASNKSVQWKQKSNTHRGRTKHISEAVIDTNTFTVSLAVLFKWLVPVVSLWMQGQISQATQPGRATLQCHLMDPASHINYLPPNHTDTHTQTHTRTRTHTQTHTAPHRNSLLLRWQHRGFHIQFYISFFCCLV